MEDPSFSGLDAPLGASSRRLCADLLAALGQRIELGSIEARIALKRALWGLLLSVTAACVLLLALVFATLGIILAFWSDQLVFAFVIAGASYALVAIVGLWLAFFISSSPPLPLTSLLNVLKEDREWILGKKPD